MAWTRRWNAEWIWWERHDSTPGVIAIHPVPLAGIGYLRTTFEMDEPREAGCRITADGRYVLYVNGVYVGRGPVRSEPSHLTYDGYDLILQPGRNCVAILARNYARPNLYFKPARPVGTLGMGAVLFELADIVSSDGSWRGMPAPYERAPEHRHGGPPPTEVLDGREVPSGWMEADFDDASWPNAFVCKPGGLGSGSTRPPTEPFGLLGPRPIPYLTERAVAPERTHGNVFDFGRIVNAHPVLHTDADAGTTIDVTCGEDLTPDGRVVAAPRHWSMRYTAAGRPGETMESFEPVGFRYVEVSGPATVTAVERKYPRPDGPFFECSDPLLTEIWRTGVRTLDLCSTDAYLDCPGREHRAWLGDAYVHTMVSFVCNPDTQLAQWNARLHAQGTRADGLLPMVASGDLTDVPVTIPDYSLHWIRTVARIHEHCGGVLIDAVPVAMRALEWFERHRGMTGLLEDLESWIFIDWAQTERGRSMAAVDALYVLALEDAATLFDAAGNEGWADVCRRRAVWTRDAFGTYWDESRGAYVDAVGGRRISQQTNAVAILSGCARRDRWERILDVILDSSRLVRTRTPGDPEGQDHRHEHQWLPPDMDETQQVVLAQPFFAHFLHQAVAHAGRADVIPELCRRWKPLLDRGNGCLEEYWTAGPGLGSCCHAWSATPTYDLSTHVLGVRPGAPGYTSVRVDPCLGDLQWAEGAVPTPRGLVRVRAERGREPDIELP
jgi:hypothetical protein